MDLKFKYSNKNNINRLQVNHWKHTIKTLIVISTLMWNFKTDVSCTTDVKMFIQILNSVRRKLLSMVEEVFRSFIIIIQTYVTFYQHNVVRVSRVKVLNIYYWIMITDALMCYHFIYCCVISSVTMHHIL